MSEKDMKCEVCGKTCTIAPFIHIGCLRFAKIIKDTLQQLTARSVFELLPARMFEVKEQREAYYLGCRETEEQWHKIIGELLRSNDSDKEVKNNE